jgi:Uma2 family endonuclease
MSDIAETRPMTASEYLAWEREQVERHEFHRGEVFATSGGSLRHNFLANAAGAELRAAVRPLGCHVLSSDQRIGAHRGERYVYADVVVACGRVEIEPDTTDVLANPTIVVEVLSPSTEAYDRGLKWETYQNLASLTDYLLVSEAAVRVEHFRRLAGGGWSYTSLVAGDSVTLSNGAVLSVDALYDGALELPASAER